MHFLACMVWMNVAHLCVLTLIVLLITQQIQANVNVTSELHAKSTGLCQLTLPTYSDSTKQVIRHFIRHLDQYFSLWRLTNYAYLWYSERYENVSRDSGFPVRSINLRSYDKFKKAFTELLWNPSWQPSIRSSIYLVTTQILVNHAWIITSDVQIWIQH
jgi:hypothetical protein